MEFYWAHLARGADPVGALRAARLQWLDGDPNRRSSPRLWAGLTALGGAHC
ncbi:hypothetical protein AB0D99_32160 [Streptomyces sp. NPDC047971]|uniref:hypothetical protein n=1 Tax=Streptomyces sp. NPDC047971 TaxID=3154499 RepID=UPI00340A81F4